MHSGREWIVLQDQVLVVDRNTKVGGADQIAAKYPLNAKTRIGIENAISNLSPEVRGRAFDAGAMDGIGLRVSFAPDGSANQNTDIVLENTWRGELGELVEVISQAAGNEHAIPFPGIIERMDILQGQPPPINLPLPEYDRRRWGTRLPWWCWWPRLITNAEIEPNRLGEQPLSSSMFTRDAVTGRGTSPTDEPRARRRRLGEHRRKTDCCAAVRVSKQCPSTFRLRVTTEEKSKARLRIMSPLL